MDLKEAELQIYLCMVDKIFTVVYDAWVFVL